MRSKRRFLSPAVATFAAGALIVFTAIIAAASPVTNLISLTVVTGGSPYAKCSTSGDDRNFINTAIEPRVAADPRTNANGRVKLVGVWQQDRWSDGASHGLVAGYSNDSGRSWHEKTLPFSVCAAGGLSYQRASDPWISMGSDGVAYVAALSIIKPHKAGSSSAVAAMTSKDGGKSWQNLRIIKKDDGSSRYFNDKESITADPRRPGTAYIVWDRLDSTRDAGPTWFAKTTNGGRSWSKPKIIVKVDKHDQTIGNQILVDPHSGILYDFFDWIVAGFNRPFIVSFAKSTNGGKTWSSPHVITHIHTADQVAPDSGEAIRDGDIIPDAAIDPRNGILYVVWGDSRFSKSGEPGAVAISSSKNQGKSWTTPSRVSQKDGGLAFTPSVHVNSHGVVGVTYYNVHAAKENSSGLPTDYLFAPSSDGGASFSDPTTVGGTFDLGDAPRVGGGNGAFFLGDYEGLTSSGASFIPFFVRANQGDSAHRTDVVSAILQI